jgi:hypothetical protein
VWRSHPSACVNVAKWLKHVNKFPITDAVGLVPISTVYTTHHMKIMSDLNLATQLIIIQKTAQKPNEIHTKGYPITGVNKPLGIQEVQATIIFRKSAHEGGKVANPTHRPHLSPRDIPGTHFC